MMRGMQSLLGVVLLALWPLYVQSALDNRGTEFYIAFMENRLSSYCDLEIFVTTVSNTPAVVTLTMPLYDASLVRTATVSRGSSQTLKLPYGVRGSGTAIEGKGIYISSTQEISVFGVNKESYSTDAFTALPTDVIGSEYYAMTYLNDARLMVVATADSTSVSITLPNIASHNLQVSYGGTTYTDGQTISLTLNRYQTFHMVEDDSDADFTGAYIVASQNVVVFSGNKKVAIPSSGSSDHLVEQMMPVASWGKEFAVVSTPNRNIGDLVRVLASESGTTVTVAGESSTRSISSAGGFFQLDISTNDDKLITSDKPVMVGIFSKTIQSSSDGPNGGDPAFSLIVPITQYSDEVVFSTITTPEGLDFTNWVAITIDTNQKSGLLLDSSAISGATWRSIEGSSSLVTTAITVTPGAHDLYHSDPTVVFLAISSGVAQTNSYAYSAGTRVSPINTVCVVSTPVAGDTLDNDCDGRLDEETNDGIDNDGDGQIDEDLATPPRVDGSWATWGAWAGCSVTCSTGTWTRTRTCTDPAPANNGADCSGVSSETSACDAGNCPIDGDWANWGAWGTCSVTCETGTMTRTRTCTDPSPQYNGADCAGSDTDSTSCTVGVMCPIDGGWGTWQAWGACSVTCETGINIRERSCDSPAPQYNGADCSGDSNETRSCDAGIMCPIDGLWSTWGAWGTCSLTCDLGVAARSRTCTNPEPQYGGANCTGSDTDAGTCLVVYCPIDGAWSDWGSWEACSATCDAGNRQRQRNCSNPEAQYGGQDCVGETTLYDVCNEGSCLQMYIDQANNVTTGPAVDGGWSEWSNYSDCSSTCGVGVSMRQRFCNAPAPSGGGSECTGDYTETLSCYLGNCPGVTGTVYYNSSCKRHQFSCQDGSLSCLSYLYRCDCVRDCPDGSDEDPNWAGCVGFINHCRNRGNSYFPHLGLVTMLSWTLLVGQDLQRM